MHQSANLNPQKHSEQIQAFHKELANLEDANLIKLSNEQKNSIKSHHENILNAYGNEFSIDTTDSTKQLSLGMKIASFFGAFAFGAALFFIFLKFWGHLGVFAQVVLLMSVPTLFVVATMKLTQKDNNGYFTKIIATIAFAAFALNISMLGRIFNIPPSENAFLLWAIFAALLAYATGARMLLGIGIISLAAFIGAKSGTWSGIYWLSFGDRPEHFFLAAIVIFGLSFTPHHRRFMDFLPIYRTFGVLLSLLPILLLANWGRISYLSFPVDTIESIYQIIGFVLSAMIIFLGVKKGWNDLVNSGTIFFTIFLYTKLFDWFWDWLPQYLFFLLVGLIAIGVLFVLKTIHERLSKQESIL